MTVELLYWEPDGQAKSLIDVTSVGQVVSLADELANRYRGAGDVIPGLELRRVGNPESPASLSIAVTPEQWALVHTDDDMVQHRTAGEAAAPDTVADASREVRWEEATLVPRSWFISQQQALAGVSQWLADEGLSAQLTWSDNCF